MDVRCEQCGTEYEFEEARIGDSGVTVKCTACGHVFKVRRSANAASGAPPNGQSGGTGPTGARATPSPPAGREWLVRKPDAQVIAFRELTTLQKWIVEGRISRDDEISRNSETWKRLGNIAELEPFFSVFERARALNDLMLSGALGDRPVVVNGSEVLATASPLSSIVAASSPLPSPISTGRSGSTSRGSIGSGPALPPMAASPPASGAITHDGPLHSDPPGRRSAVVSRSAPARPERARGPSMATRRPDLLGFDPAAESGAASAAVQAGLGGDLAIGPDPGRTGPVPDLGRTLPRDLDDGPRPSWRPAGPEPVVAAERPTEPPRPAAATDRSLASFELDDAFFEGARARGRGRSGSRRAAVGIGVFVALGLGGGAAIATFGPEENPLRRWAVGAGVLPPPSAETPASPTPLAAELEQARRALERDGTAGLDEAERTLTPWASARQDPEAQAELALVLSTRADALRRQAARNDARAARLRAAGTARPEDVQGLERSSAALQQEASQRMARAFELVRAAYAASPDLLATNRALADYYRAQRDKGGSLQQFIQRSKTLAAAASTVDPATAYIEAADLVRDLPAFFPAPQETAPRLEPAVLEKASRLLEEALTGRPGMTRARVLLGRILVLRGQVELGKRELDRVLAEVPDQTEARELRDDLAALGTAPAAGTPEPAPTAPPVPSQPAVAVAPVPSAAARPPEAAARPSPRPGAPSEPPTRPSEAPTERASSDRGADRSTSDRSASDRGGARAPSGPAARSFDGLLKQAERLRERGEAWEALLAYEKCAELRPGAGRAYAGMGWCYLDLGKPEAALHQFRKAIAVEGSYAEGHLGHAEAYRALGNSEKALSSYRQYLTLKPQGVEAEAARRAIAALEGGR